MTRQERLREYANPRSLENWRGTSRDQACLDRWAERAEANSTIPPRARGGEMKLPDTNVELHDTAAAPKSSGDVRAKAKADLNFVGESPYLRSVRRTG
jgi:hypothetical protein